MKKLLLSFFLSLAAIIGVQAEEVSMTFSEQGYSNAQELTTIKLDDNVSLVLSKGTGTTTPKYYNSGTNVRVYTNNTLELVASNSAVTINSVEFICTDKYLVTSSHTITSGTLSTSGTTVAISDVNSSTFSLTNTQSAQIRITRITVTYTVGVATSVSTPVITPSSGEITADTEISITCSTDGATIYYTTDGTEPSSTNGTKYTTAFTLDAAATLKAIAYADGLEASDVAEVAYTSPCANISAFITAANSYASTISGDVTVVAQSGNYLFIQDETAKIVVFGSLNNTYSNGDKLSGIKGTYTLYRGLPEMSPIASSFGTATSGTAVEPETITLSKLGETPLLTFVKLEGVTVPESSSSSYTITDATGTATMYNTLGVDVAAGENLTIIGFVSCYNTTIQLMPLEVTSASGLAVASAPVITPNGGTIDRTTAISITSADEGVSIYYTLDGTEPSAQNGTLYSESFTLNEDATVRAIAVGEGYANSVVSEAAFTLLGENTYVVTYDFTNPAGLNPVQSTPAKSSGIAVNDVLFTNGAIGIVCTKNEASTDCRLWGGTSIVDLRTYTKSTITISGSSAKIVSIVFDGSKASASQLSANSGTLTGSSWVPAGDVNSVVFTTTATTNIETITVTYEIQPFELNVSSAEWATLCLGYNAAIPADVKVYTATIDGTVATLNEVTGVLPANTGVIVNAAQGNYTFQATSDAASEVAENDLVGTLYNTTLTPGANNYYILANGANGIGLYLVDEDPDTEGYEAFTMGANKAYLSIAGEAASNGFSFRIEGTTAIDEVEAAETGEQVIYDLTGRRVESINAPGIYIVNGKKVVIK